MGAGSAVGLDGVLVARGGDDVALEVDLAEPGDEVGAGHDAAHGMEVLVDRDEDVFNVLEPLKPRLRRLRRRELLEAPLLRRAAAGLHLPFDRADHEPPDDRLVFHDHHHNPAIPEFLPSLRSRRRRQIFRQIIIRG